MLNSQGVITDHSKVMSPHIKLILVNFPHLLRQEQMKGTAADTHTDSKPTWQKESKLNFARE